MKLSESQLERAAKTIILRKYQLAKNQAVFRGQEWHLTKQEFLDIWRENELWLDGGHTMDGYVFSRIDMTADWTVDNVHIVTREQMLKNRTNKRKET